jgi:predicted lipid-binding transport protein (Tim44 family)
MNITLTRLIGIALVVVASLAWVVEAEARRLGGGRTMGRQSNTTQRDAAPAQPAAAPRPGQTAQQQGAAAGQTAAAGSRSRWMAPIAGLAAGLGLAALANWLGFGEELASIMLIALLAIAVLVVFRMIMARRQTGPRPAFQGGYQGGGLGADSNLRRAPLPQDQRGGRFAPSPSASPAGGSNPAGAGASAGTGLATGAGAAAAAAGAIPAGFDVEGFLRTAKVQFVRLQAVHDAGDLNDLREFTTPEMFAELKLDVAGRGGRSNRTDVVTLDASLLGVESTAVDHLASVRFTGMIREEEGGEAHPFDEVWVLSKPVAGGGWVLAGIQQLG